MKTSTLHILAMLILVMAARASAKDLDDYFDLNETDREIYKLRADSFASGAAAGGAWDTSPDSPQPPPDPDLVPIQMEHACKGCGTCVHPTELVYSRWAIHVTDYDRLSPNDHGAFTNMESFSAAVGSEDWSDALGVEGYWYVLYRAREAASKCDATEAHECGRWETHVFEHWLFGCTGKVTINTTSEHRSSSSSSVSGSVSGDAKGGASAGASASYDASSRTSCRYFTKGEWEFFWKRVDQVTRKDPCSCGTAPGMSPNGLPIPMDDRQKKSSDAGGDRVPIAGVASADVVATIEALGGGRYDFHASGDRPVTLELVGATADYLVDDDPTGLVGLAKPGSKDPVQVAPGSGKDVGVLGRQTDGGPEVLVCGFRPPKRGKGSETPRFRGTTKAIPTGPNQGLTPPIVLTGISPKTGAVPQVEFTSKDEKGRRRIAVFLPDVVVTDADGKKEVGGRILVNDLGAWNRPGAKIQVTLTDPSTGEKILSGTVGKDLPVEDPETGEDRSSPSAHRAQPRVTAEPAEVKPGMLVTARADVSPEDMEALEAAGYPREALEIRITGPDGKEIARGPAPGPVVGTTRATSPGTYQVRAEIELSRDPRAWRRAQANAEAAERSLCEALKGLPGIEEYAKQVLAERVGALKRLSGGK